MIVYELTLPLPPSDNHLYTVARGRKILSAAGRTYRDEVWLAVKLAKLPKLEGNLWIIARMFPKTKHIKFDATNRAKALHDALTYSGLIGDDCQLKEAKQIADKPVPGGRCEVLIGVLE